MIQGPRAVHTIALLACLLGASCRSHEDVTARYRLEKKLWRAQVWERKININFLRASPRDLRMAISAFNDVVAYDPLAQSPASEWDPGVVHDIRKIQVVSKIALASLYFLSERYQDAGDFYARTLAESDLSFDKRLDVRLNLARTMYLAGEADALEANCAQIFEDLSKSGLVFDNRSQLKEVFLNVPIVLARIYRDRGDRAKLDAHSASARRFYSRVAEAWPDSAIAARAKFSLVNLHLVREEWQPALAEIDRLIQHRDVEGRSQSLLLLKGEILAYALKRTGEGRAVFREILKRFPDSASARAARLNMATLELEDGDAERGLQMLKDVETSKSAPAEIIAKSMLSRAIYLESIERWDEAITLLRRIIRLYPHTSSAIESPLVMTRHYLDKGDAALAETSLMQAREFYVPLISRDSNYEGDRLKIQDFLIENYLMMGKAAEVAVLLEKRSAAWDDVSTAGALLRSAAIHADLLEDSGNAARILKKCIELFPETRYAKIAKRQLDRLEKG